MNPSHSPKIRFKFFYSFLLIYCYVKWIYLNMLTYDQMNNKRVCNSRKDIRKSPWQLPDTIFTKRNKNTFTDRHDN